MMSLLHTKPLKLLLKQLLAYEEVTLEKPQQQTPNPQMASISSSDHVTCPEHVSPSEHVSVPEYIVLEHYVYGQILTPTIPETINEPDNIITSDATDIEIEQFVSNVVIEFVSDQPSTNNTQPYTTTNSQTSTSHLQLVPVKPTKIPSLPTILLDSTLLQNVCESIGQELVKLIEERNNFVHQESYEKQWKRLKERVDFV
jgi:hypothetical protein